MIFMRNIRIKNKNNKNGFTLAETLLAVLIMLMVSSIVATGIPAAKNAYEKVVLASNAEVLLSTTVSLLRNELGTAREIEKTDATTITFLNSVRGSKSRIFLDADKNIMIYKYKAVDGIGKDSEPELLISSEAATADLYVTYNSLDYDQDNNLITFRGLSVDRKSGAKGLANRDTITIDVMTN